MPIINSIFRHSFNVDGKEIDANLDNIRLLTPMFNVKEFGAMGDGVTDDGTAIRDALVHLNSNGGGTLFFPAGTYMVGLSLVVYSNTTLMGESYGSVTLKATAAMNDRLIQNQARLGSGTDTDIHFKNIIFDMNGTNQTGSTAVTIARVNRHRVECCTFQGPYDSTYLLTGASDVDDNTDAIYEQVSFIGTGQSQTTDVVNIGNARNVVMNNCRAYDAKTGSGQAMLSIAAIDHFVVTNCYFDGNDNGVPLSMFGMKGGKVDGCEIKNSTEGGLRYQRWTEGSPDKDFDGFSIVNNDIHDNLYYGIWVRQDTGTSDIPLRVNIAMNRIYNNERDGILCEVANGIHITHNFVYNNSKASAGTYYAMNFNQVGSSSTALTNIIVDYNRFFDTQGTPTQTKLFNLNYVDTFHSYRNEISNVTTKYTVANSSNYYFYDGDTDYYVGTLTRDLTAASGNVSYTGVGFTPRAIVFLGAKAGTLQSTIGFTDNASDHAIALLGTTVAYDTYTTTACISFAETAAILQTAVLSSFDSDGFTLTWTKTGAPAAGTGRAFYLALR